MRFLRFLKRRWDILTTFAVGLLLVVSLQLDPARRSPNGRPDHPIESERADHAVDHRKVRLEFLVVDADTEQPIPEARLLLSHEYRLDKIPPEDLAPPTGVDGCTMLDLSIPGVIGWRDYSYEITAAAGGYEPFRVELQDYTRDRKYHTLDLPPPVMIRLKRQPGASVSRSHGLTGSTRAALWDATGTWSWGYKNPKYQEVVWTLRLKQDGEKISGTLAYSVGGAIRSEDVTAIKDAAIKNNVIKFTTENQVWDGVHKTEYSGNVEGNAIRGRTVTIHNDREEWISGWEAERVPDESPSPKLGGKPG